MECSTADRQIRAGSRRSFPGAGTLSRVAEPWTPSNPDGYEEHLFVPLEAEDPALADRLRRRFVDLWLREGRLPLHRFDEALETVELRVAPDETPGRWRLRLRSFYTGTTYWLYDWDRSTPAAEAWVDGVAELQGANVNEERRYGPSDWDEHRWGTSHPGHPRSRHPRT
jgi:hypothetical protein